MTNSPRTATRRLRLIGAIEKFNLIPVSDQPTMKLCARFFGAAHLVRIPAADLKFRIQFIFAPSRR